MTTESDTSIASAVLRLVGSEDEHGLPTTAAEFRIGRDPDCDFVLDHSAVSRAHARVVHDGDTFLLTDLVSANGTFVERGQELLEAKEPLVLGGGDVIRIGPYRLVFDDGTTARVDPQGGQPWSNEIDVPTVAAGFCHFFAGFMIWALPAVLAADIGADLGLSKGAIPMLPAAAVLFGAVARLSFGLLTDARGPFVAGGLALGVGFVPLVALAVVGGEAIVVWPSVALLGVGLASVAVSMPMTSRRTAPERRGLALGIVSAGSVGIVVAGIVGPLLARAMSWEAVFALAIIPAAVCFAVFLYGARGSWTQPPAGEWLRLFRRPSTQFVALLFGITFGGFAGLYSFLPTLLRGEDYELGDWAPVIVALGALAGGGMRVIGGLLADRFGPLRVIPYAVAGVAALLVFAGSVPVGIAIATFIGTMALFDMGTAAVFKLAAQRFGAAIGAGIGVMSAAGGVVGFGVTLLLNQVVEMTDNPTAAFAILATAPAGLAVWLFVDARLRPEERARLDLPAAPHLQRLDPYGNPFVAIELGGGLTIGRAPGNRLVLTDDLVSRRHVAIETRDGKTMVRDLGSTNSTMLWREKRWQPVEVEELHNSDVLVIGANVFRFSTGGAVAGG